MTEAELFQALQRLSRAIAATKDRLIRAMHSGDVRMVAYEEQNLRNLWTGFREVARRYQAAGGTEALSALETVIYRVGSILEQATRMILGLPYRVLDYPVALVGHTVRQVAGAFVPPLVGMVLVAIGLVWLAERTRTGRAASRAVFRR